MAEKTLGDILTKIGDDAQSSLGMTREQVIALAERKKVLVGGTLANAAQNGTSSPS